MTHPSIRLLPIMLLASCNHGLRTSSTVTTTSPGGATRTEVLLTGDPTSVHVNGDTLEVRAGQVWINAESFGSVGTGQEVRCVFENGQRVLTVDEQVRVGTHR